MNRKKLYLSLFLYVPECFLQARIPDEVDNARSSGRFSPPPFRSSIESQHRGKQHRKVPLKAA